MGENAKHQILSQEMVRRILNTSEGAPEGVLEEITDKYAEKLHNSGYKLEHIRRIILSGIKGYASKKERCEKEGRNLRRTAEESKGARMRTKLTGKSTWFKKRRGNQQEDQLGSSKGDNGKRAKGALKKRSEEPPSTVLFVEQTPNGELAARLRELLRRLEPTLGFGVKIVEKTGANLKSCFPLYNLWDGNICGRKECIPCAQEADFVQPCTKNSVVYENICASCNPEAGGKKELEQVVTNFPTTYIGETSRSIMERTREHWRSYRSKNKDSHILKHQELQHGGAPPKFIMRVVGKAKSALERQTKEAVRIRRRGGEGAILNSKAEFNRCYIPRLRLEEEQIIEEMEQKEKEHDEMITRELDNNLKQWEQEKREEKGAERRRIAKEQGGAQIRERGKQKKEQGARISKRRKFELVGKE